MRIGETIYCDYQASTPIDPIVVSAIASASQSLFANPHSTDHSLGWNASLAVSDSAATIARFVGMDADDLIFTSGATEANAMALYAIRNLVNSTGKKKIMVGEGDHSSVRKFQFDSDIAKVQIPLTSDGAPNTNWLSANLTDDFAGVSVIGVNNENGAISDLTKISKICGEKRVLLHVDLAQGLLAADIDLSELEVSFTTLSAHKIYGPKGIGALICSPYDRKNLIPFMAGGGQQNGLRGGTIPTELCVGFAAAIEILNEKKDSERTRVRKLRDYFVNQIVAKGLGELVGDLANRHPGNALIRFPNCDSSDLLSRLQPIVAASSQSACSSGLLVPSEIVLAMGYDRKVASETVRFSFGRFSTVRQINDVVAYLSKSVFTLRY